MAQDPTEFSTNQTPGTAPGSGSGAAPLRESAPPVTRQPGQWQNTLADRLEAGAERLRSRDLGASTASTAGDGSIALEEPQGRMTQVGDTLADGMKSTASWIREADLDSMRETVERQVREHPARSLLIAIGLGYVIGKAFRK